MYNSYVGVPPEYKVLSPVYAVIIHAYHPYILSLRLRYLPSHNSSPTLISHILHFDYSTTHETFSLSETSLFALTSYLLSTHPPHSYWLNSGYYTLCINDIYLWSQEDPTPYHFIDWYLVCNLFFLLHLTLSSFHLHHQLTSLSFTTRSQAPLLSPLIKLV